MNRSNTHILSTILVTIALAACNKGNNTPPQNPVGEFVLIKGFPSGPEYSLEVLFSQTDEGPFQNRGGLGVDSVLVNGRGLVFNSFSANYSLPDVDSVFSQGPLTWEVRSSNGIPSFTHVDSLHFAQFALVMPVTLDKTKGLTVSLTSNSLSANDSAWVYISGDSILETRAFSKTSWSVTLTPAELTKVQPGDQLYIEARSMVRDSILVNGVRFRFYRQAIKNGTIVVK